MRLFIEPTEPLLFRTGRPFNAGETNYAQTLFPPTPETLQGAIRTAIATHWDRTKTLLEVFQQHELVDLIGDRTSYGRFRITGISLGRFKKEDTKDKGEDIAIERLFPIPSHLLQEEGGKKQQAWLIPQLQKMKGIYTDLPDEMRLLYPDKDTENKLEPIWEWLTARGLQKALVSKEDIRGEIIESRDIYVYEPRLGIGMNNETKTTREGLLYQTRMVRMNPQIDHEFIYGFIVDIRLTQSSERGTTTTYPEALVDDDHTQELLRLPNQGWIILGGERRAARFKVLKLSVSTQQDNLEHLKRGNLLYLATPAAFKGGWQPEQWPAPLSQPIAAAINRYQSIGGWSLRPADSGGENKIMRRCVPAGSVYFFDKSVTVTQPLTDYGWQIGYGIAYAGEW